MSMRMWSEVPTSRDRTYLPVGIRGRSPSLREVGFDGSKSPVMSHLAIFSHSLRRANDDHMGSSRMIQAGTRRTLSFEKGRQALGSPAPEATGQYDIENLREMG